MKILSKIPTWIPITLVGIFILWILNTFVPILLVESRYQIQNFFAQQLKITSLKQLFVPDFSAFSDVGASYKDFGLYIPSIYLNEPIVANVDANDKKSYQQALKKGIAHAAGTPFPDSSNEWSGGDNEGGNSGNIGYYFAHSSSSIIAPNSAVFYLLGKLKTGDLIYLWHNQEKYTYQVTQTMTTPAKQTDFLDQHYTKETIVLQTCWPIGSNQQRLLVFAERE